MSGKAEKYKDAGVNIDEGNRLVDNIKPAARATERPGTMSALGGFGACFDLKAAGYSDPILVAATDGVGTKLKIAIEMQKFDTIGQDLVAMCVNDLICQGAEPLFFLDYYATGKLDVDAASEIINGIASACKATNTALIGGETAEMPGMYQGDDFDLAGFAVGAMERGEDLPQNVEAGDILIALPSSGVHSNGFSLVRKIISDQNLTFADKALFADAPLGDVFLTPTKLYVKPCVRAMKAGLLNAMAHITGGGILENLPRVLPEGLGANIDLSSWTLPPVFSWLKERGGLTQDEMLTTFNSGVGMILVASKDNVDALTALLREDGEACFVIGEVTKTEGITTKGALV